MSEYVPSTSEILEAVAGTGDQDGGIIVARQEAFLRWLSVERVLAKRDLANQIDALVRLLGSEEMTPTATRMFRRVLSPHLEGEEEE